VDLFLACVAAGVAGMVDAVAGGGGLLQLPALLLLMPDAPFPLALGTNKAAGIWGTSAAAVRYGMVVPVPWRTVRAAAGVAFVASLAGARLAGRADPSVMRPLVLVLLAAVALFTFLRPDFGRFASTRERPVLGMVLGGILGLYDGFFGPGTGSFLIFAFVGTLGLDFLGASAAAKVVNVSTNLAAILAFGMAGSVRWEWALPMGAASIAGSMVGSRLALTRGVGLVRRVFQGVVVALMVKLAWEWG
jgi:uncharacterized membrane protein YfcA